MKHEFELPTTPPPRNGMVWIGCITADGTWQYDGNGFHFVKHPKPKKGWRNIPVKNICK